MSFVSGGIADSGGEGGGIELLRGAAIRGLLSLGASCGTLIVDRLLRNARTRTIEARKASKNRSVVDCLSRIIVVADRQESRNGLMRG